MKRFVLMGSLCAASLLPATRARAQPTILDVADNRVGVSYSHIDFGANKALDRAWAVVHYSDTAPCPTQADMWCDVDVPVRVNVPGLSYEPSKQQVVYTTPGRAPVVCAEFKDGDKLEPTGNCAGRLTKVTQTVDDGFDVSKQTHRDVVLTVTEPSHENGAVAKK